MTRTNKKTETDSEDAAPRWRRRAADRPREIIDAALTVFVEKGFAATKLDDVAVAAGISKGLLYRYFDNKAELLKEVIRQTLGTVAWGREVGRFGSVDIRVGVPKTTQMKLQTYEHELGPGGATRLGPFDSDEVNTKGKGWMVGSQYLLPLADQLKVGFDVSRHQLGEASGRFAGNPKWWKFAIFVELGNSRRGHQKKSSEQAANKQ